MEFKELHLIEPILEALTKEGYTTPTPIQEKTIPLLLDKKDVIGIAQTGTGKTASFTVPILQHLHKTPAKSNHPRALILAPTRELVAQISESFKTYGKFLHLKHAAIYGGVGIIPQIKKIQHGIDILIATPGRLIDLMNQGKVRLDKIEFLTLDEADRMLDMGFLKDVGKIVSALPEDRQSLFFSATMSNQIADLTRQFLKNPVRVEVTPQSTPVERIEQCVFFIDQENKNELLLDLIVQEKMSCILVFVAAKYKADRIAKMLNGNGMPSDSIHGNKSQYQRTRALQSFKEGKVRVLVATDIAARGIDIDNISHVINYDLPNEPENYIHRIGRTARAGSAGTAYSFCAAEDRNYLNQIERKTKMRTPHAEHKYHSLTAKNAKGDAAKPKPRGMRNRNSRANDRRGGRTRRRDGEGGSGGSYTNEGFRRSRPGPSGKPRGERSNPRESKENDQEKRGNSRRGSGRDDRKRAGNSPRKSNYSKSRGRNNPSSRRGRSAGRSTSQRVRSGRTSSRR